MNKLFFLFFLFLSFKIQAQSQQESCDTCAKLERLVNKQTYNSYKKRCFQRDTILTEGSFNETREKHFCKDVIIMSRYNAQDTIPVFSYEIVNHKDTVFTHSEKPATFVGGESALIQYVIKNLIYPRAAERKNIEGKVSIQFFVSKTGKLYNFGVLRRANESLEEEALRVLTAMPDWEAGQHNGKPVIYKVIFPVRFKLPSNMRY